MSPVQSSPVHSPVQLLQRPGMAAVYGN